MIPLAVRNYKIWILDIEKLTPGANERRRFKQRLSVWVKMCEFILLALLVTVTWNGIFYLSTKIHSLLHANISGMPTAGLIALPAVFISVLLSMITANYISLITPPLRKANKLAMQGNPAASFEQKSAAYSW